MAGSKKLSSLILRTNTEAGKYLSYPAEASLSVVRC